MSISGITQDIKTTLAAITTYGGTPTVELERLFLDVNDRYPYIELCGPYSEIDTEPHNVADTTLEYNLKYYVNYNDEDQTEDEITFKTRNVTGDIIKALMVDTTRGGNATVTNVTDYGHFFEELEHGNEFYVYVTLDIMARIEATDPSLLG